jgi:predicted nucleotidyltransferase
VGKISKENNVLELFFNNPIREWHFKEIIKESKVQKSSAAIWLRKFQKENIIKHVKPKGKMPYYIAAYNNQIYYNKKRLYGLSLLSNSGLIDELQQLKKANTVVIFGSFARGDWHINSDVDVFIIGDSEKFKYGKIWKGIGISNKTREIQVLNYRTKKDLKKIRTGLIKNIINGYFIKGGVQNIIEVS